MSIAFLHVLVLKMSMKASLIAYLLHTCVSHTYKTQGNCNVLWTVHRDIFCDKNQQDVLFTFNLFRQLTSTCFEQVYCSSSGGNILYKQQLVSVMLKIMELCKIT